ncbi:MAG TPA: cyanophycinase [Gemmatimonas sp.]|nr:cyanophycinase [Gemmatimonas sp.]
MIRTRSGRLIVIGGHEDKEDERVILRAVANEARNGALVVVTAASDLPHEVWADYEPIFRDLGVEDVRQLHVDSREQALDETVHGVLDGATCVFFTGGDQLKLTSQLGDTPVFQKTRAIYESGGCVAGTSAGASVVCETMMVSGGSSASPRVGDALRMAPGFGFVSGVIIDQHFAERGRIGRLIGAVAQNPRILGIGVDENTALICEHGVSCTVLGEGAVYFVDARDVTQSNVVDDSTDRTLSVFNIRLHLLNMGDEFDLQTRVPACHSTEQAEAKAGIS